MNGEKLHTVINVQLKSFSKLIDKLATTCEHNFRELRKIFDREIEWVTKHK